MGENPSSGDNKVSMEPGAGESLEAQVESDREFDIRLAHAIKAKDRKAAADLVEQHADSVYSYVRRRLFPRADRIEDVTQEVFLAALDGIHGYRGTSPLRHWLMGIARHKVEDHYRRTLREPEPWSASAGDPEDASPALWDGSELDAALDRKAAEERVHKILQDLPETYATVLLWRYWERRSAKEIADAVGKSEKAVERLLARARARFKWKWDHE